MTARIDLSWPEDRKVIQASVTVEVEGVEIDEIVDALVAGLAATEGREYKVEAAEISEIITRPLQASRLKKRTVVEPRKVVVRPQKGNNSPSPVTPGALSDPVTPEDKPARVRGRVTID